MTFFRHLVVMVICSVANFGAAEETGFVPLFDGTTFKGWIGGPELFEISNGTLVSKAATNGNMLTERDFEDFVLRFEFLLTPGANSGLGVRIPAEGDGSYDGIELQILDDTADQYKNLKPYQFHGSAYGIAPAKRGALRPVGEWNQEEIRCSGRQITVVLNGKTILDVDLDEAAPNGKTIDGMAHPGLSNHRGRIGILCHDDEVAFRSIRVKELSRPKRTE